MNIFQKTRPTGLGEGLNRAKYARNMTQETIGNQERKYTRSGAFMYINIRTLCLNLIAN